MLIIVCVNRCRVCQEQPVKPLCRPHDSVTRPHMTGRKLEKDGRTHLVRSSGWTQGISSSYYVYSASS